MLNGPADVLSNSSKSCLHELILANTDSTFLLLDKNLHVLYLNDATRQKIRMMYGQDVSVGTSIIDLTAPDRREAIKNIYKAALQGEPQSFVIEKRVNGILHAFENKLRPAYNHYGQIAGILIQASDISEKYHAEQKLRQAEERWRFALEGGRQGVWDWDISTGKVFFSAACQQIYGYAPNEMSGNIEEWKSLLHPEDKPKVLAAVTKHIIINHPSENIHYRVKHKKGHYIWIEAKGMIVSRDENGNPTRMIGTHTDVTELKDANEKYRLLFFNNPIPMWTFDADNRKVLEVNDAALAHYGYSSEQFLNFTIAELTAEESIKELDSRIDALFQKGNLQFSTRHRKANDEKIDVEVTCNLLRYEKGTRVLMAAKDITEKKKYQETLKLSNELYKHVTLATHDMIWDWDVEAGTIRWSESYFRQFGWPYPPDGVIGLTDCLEKIHYTDREEVGSSLREVIDNSVQTNWKAEFRYSMADGAFAFVADRAYIIRDSQGKAVRVIGAMRDITERKHNEILLSVERSFYAQCTDPNVDLAELVERLLKSIEIIHPEAKTLVSLRDEKGFINALASNKVDQVFINAFYNKILQSDEGACGAAVHNRTMVIVDNMATHPLCQQVYASVKKWNIASCWSLPVVDSSANVIGLLSFYHEQPKSPTGTELTTMERIVNILRTVLENRFSVHAIKDANERFDLVMQATHDMIWDWDMQTNMVYREKTGLERIYGSNNATNIEHVQQWIERVHPDDQPSLLSAIEQLIHNDNNTFEAEYRFQKEDDTWLYLYDRGKLIRSKHGQPIRLIGAAQDITERKRLEQEVVNHMLERQKAINQATVETQEQERREIGKELHDNINQVLTTTKLYLELAASHPELKDGMIQKSSVNIIKVINEIRQLSRSLIEPSLGDLGLEEAIGDLVENLNLTRRINISFAEHSFPFQALGKNESLTLFRIIQEALNNTIKHASATNAGIELRLNGTEGLLCIKDNGKGFQPQFAKKGSGLKNIQNRVYLINGKADIISAPGNGTQISVRFPINN
jgi:PAS domain S-box-containing protein